MRISDWSSDVCSSDLIGSADLDSAATTVGAGATNSIAIGRNVKVSDNSTSSVGLGSNVSLNASNAVGIGVSASAGGAYGVAMGCYANAGAEADRKSVVWGKSGSGRVDLGGRCLIQKKKK